MRTNGDSHAAARRWLGALALAWLLLFGASPALAGKRVALIIANAHYAAVPALRTPPADAALVAQSLRRAGFASVTLIADADKSAMEAALRSFGRSADGAEIALVYYAGHGIEVGGQNYLIPIDARLAQDRDADLEAIRLDSVRGIAAHAQLRLVILDACRDNPFLASMTRTIGTRGLSRGLADIEKEDGEAVFYSTRAGATAADGEAANSPFAAALARWMTEPGIDLGLMMRKVRAQVLRETGSVQQPYWYESLPENPFYFVAPSGATTVAPVTQVPQTTINGSQIEALVWQGALTANSEDAFADYLRQYPTGTFSGQARAIVRRLRLPATEATAPTSSVAAPTVNSEANPTSADDAVAMGYKYQLGQGVPQNYTTAAYWYRKSADAGNIEGMFNLGIMYHLGQGVRQDDADAITWLKRAAEAGSVKSYNQLASIYANGPEGVRDVQQAARWYCRAADAGDEGSVGNCVRSR